MFTISVAGLMNSPAEERRYQLTGEVEALVGFDGQPIPMLVPVELVLSVINAMDFLWVVGVVKGAMQLVCSRCLREFDLPMEGRFEEKYRMHGSGADDDEELLVAKDDLDFADHVRESLVLSLPMKPLCHLQCQGLCMQCGRDLNVGECGCAREANDPRFLKLVRFSDQMEGGGRSGSAQE